jgi:CBS domain-containing protein
MPVSKLMTPPSQWPQIRGDADVYTVIRLLRIITEDEKLEHGHSTPLIMDENYNLLGFVHLSDLLKSIRHMWEKKDQIGKEELKYPPVRDLVVKFEGTVTKEDNIVKALDIMMEHNVSLVPVVSNGKLEGMLRLADIFNEVAALLFDEESPEEKHRLLRDYHIM